MCKCASVGLAVVSSTKISFYCPLAVGEGMREIYLWGFGCEIFLLLRTAETSLGGEMETAIYIVSPGNTPPLVLTSRRVVSYLFFCSLSF